MPIHFQCPLCAAKFQVDEKHSGKTAQCRKCGGTLVVPQTLPQFPTGMGARAASTAAATRPPRSFADRQRAILAALPETTLANRVPLVYRLSVLLVSLVMVLLPVVYVAFVFAIGLGALYHLTHHTGMLQVRFGRASIVLLIAYIAPVVIGGIAVVFMFKPLLARRAHVRRSRALTPNGEPLLFAFVARLAAVVGAPQPKRIEVDSSVNASASFRRGWFSVLLGNDLTLTIGVPLMAGLSMRQFAGVLAHELGHFRQGAGMRVSYVVRSISAWFTRVVYERDAWDVWLEQVTADMDFRLGWVFVIAQGAVWVSRRVLWLLMLTGYAVAGVLLRQMEFDADRQQIRLAGSECFRSTMWRIHELNLAADKSLVDLLRLFQKGRLGDNLPQLILLNAATMPNQVQAKLRKHLQEARTGWFDSHPCLEARITRALQDRAEGAFRLEAPATDLLLHGDALYRNVTWDFYRDVTGAHVNPERLEPIDELLNEAAGRQ